MYEVRPLHWSLAQLKAAWDKTARFSIFSDDGPQTLQQFEAYVIGTGSVWFEVVDVESAEQVGLVYLNGFVQSYSEKTVTSAFFHAIMWDSNAAGRRNLAQPLLHRLFKLFRLHRLEARVPAHHGGAIRAMKRIGFKGVGRIPKAVRYGDVWIDLVILSLLEEDLDG